ncbi:MAG: DUF4326 domain-containing protein [Candidatus Deferrimicrobiaceae bacterium]
MPERIQLRRTKGWRKPEGAVVVARPSKWGNPYKLDLYRCEGGPMPRREAAYMAVRDFEAALYAGQLNISVADVRRELAGKDLCCWCPPDAPCHAVVLLAYANSPNTPDPGPFFPYAGVEGKANA